MKGDYFMRNSTDYEYETEVKRYMRKSGYNRREAEEAARYNQEEEEYPRN